MLNAYQIVETLVPLLRQAEVHFKYLRSVKLLRKLNAGFFGYPQIGKGFVIYLPEPDAVPQVFEGVCGGRILEEPRGEGGFGYDPLFFSDELGRTFEEASAEEKDAVSHRGRAVRALAEALRSA